MRKVVKSWDSQYRCEKKITSGGLFSLLYQLFFMVQLFYVNLRPVCYLYMQIKYKSITVYIKNKREDGYIIVSEKELFSLSMFPSNKQNQLRQMKKDEIKKESYLNYTYWIKIFFLLLPCLFVFHQMNLLNVHVLFYFHQLVYS